MRAGPKAAVDGSPLPLAIRRRRSAAVARFARDYIVVPRGHGARKPLRLRPWQRELVAATWDARPRPRLAGWMLPRGQGKRAWSPCWRCMSCCAATKAPRSWW
jgi:hypothetical protein